MTPLEWSDLVRNAALTIASLLGAGIGFAGLRSWKAQKRWERDNELARRFLVSLIGYQSAINELRFRTLSPTLVPQIEIPDVLREKSGVSLDEDGHFQELAEHIVQKTDVARKIKVEFEAISLEARAIWGWPSEEESSKLFELHTKLLMGLEWYMRLDDPSNNAEDHEIAAAAFEEYDGIVIEPTRTADLFQSDLRSVVSNMEMFLKTKLDVSQL